MTDLNSLSVDELTKLYYANEKRIKALDNEQKTKKTLANSIYGCSGQANFLFFDTMLAEAVTVGGQLSVRTATNAGNAIINGYLGNTTNKNYHIASDTDSNYFGLQDIVESCTALKADLPENKIVDILDKFVKTVLDPAVNKACAELADNMNWVENRLNFKREAISKKAVWRGKKMYAQAVLDMEGVRYAEPDIKITGIEAVRSSTPEWCRTRIKEALRILLTDTEEAFQAYIKKCRTEWQTLPVEAMACPRGTNTLGDYRLGDKAIPIACRAALVYNKMLELHPIKNAQPIQPGNKIKFVYLKEPNKARSNVIGFPGKTLPPEFGLEKYVDKNLQFDKTFMSGLETMCDVIGWAIEKQATLGHLGI